MWPFGPLVYVVTLLFGFVCGCRGFCHRTESVLFPFLWFAWFQQKIYKPWLKECAYRNNRQYSDQNSGSCYNTINLLFHAYFQCHYPFSLQHNGSQVTYMYVFLERSCILLNMLKVHFEHSIVKTLLKILVLIEMKPYVPSKSTFIALKIFLLNIYYSNDSFLLYTILNLTSCKVFFLQKWAYSKNL